MGHPDKVDTSADVRLNVAYEDLRRLAGHFLSRQRSSHTLQPTALVHEAYLRLARSGRIGHGSDIGERQFIALAARAMRSVLVDHARSRSRQKRGGNAVRMPLDDVVDLYEQRATDLPALDEALEGLAAFNADEARVVELRFFGGLSTVETAELLGVSTRTVERMWERARNWLRARIGMTRGPGRPGP
jgi:RNA polymerase sigma factor (TIGR02999 family)